MDPSVHNPKEAAGRRAAELIEDGMRVGLGTGSTVFFTLARLAERIAAEGLALHCVPTSIDTEAKARELGLPTTVVIFEPLPREFFAPQHAPARPRARLLCDPRPNVDPPQGPIAGGVLVQMVEPERP